MERLHHCVWVQILGDVMVNMRPGSRSAASKMLNTD